MMFMHNTQMEEVDDSTGSTKKKSLQNVDVVVVVVAGGLFIRQFRHSLQERNLIYHQ